jgi:hypothetical protein
MNTIDRDTNISITNLYAFNVNDRNKSNLTD